MLTEKVIHLNHLMSLLTLLKPLKLEACAKPQNIACDLFIYLRGTYIYLFIGMHSFVAVVYFT